MLHALQPGESSSTAPLFAALDSDLALASILAGKSPALVYADDPFQPRAAFTWFNWRAFLAGDPAQPGFITALARLLDEQLIPQARARGMEAFILHIEPQGWEPALSALLGGRQVNKWRRHYYACRALQANWRPLLPPGYELRLVDAALLADAGLRNQAALALETQSERCSVADFLAQSFGYCLVRSDEIASWCLSEYNLADRCEVGVATVEAHQRRGLATVTTLALLERAFASGITQVGWHCWANNAGSIALALRTGFEKVNEYPVYICRID
jgi:GNAT superfamily N-acetyltransferase